MAQAGGCICGNVRYTVEGEPVMKVGHPMPGHWHRLTPKQALCHCTDCRKITGSTYSTNAVYPGSAFKVTQGTPKEHGKKSDTGTTVVSHFW